MISEHELYQHYFSNFDNVLVFWKQTEELRGKGALYPQLTFMGFRTNTETHTERRKKSL